MKGLLFAILAVAFASCADGQPISWFPKGPPGHVTALALGHQNFFHGEPPSTIFAAMGGAGVLQSVDQGSTWTPTGPGLEGAEVVALAVVQTFQVYTDYVAYTTTVYAGTSNAGVLRLDPDATAWVPMISGLTTLDVKALVAGSNNVVYAGTPEGAYASTNCGSWARKGPLLFDGVVPEITALAAEPFSATLYAGTAGFGLFKSKDGGDHWESLETGSNSRFAVSALLVDPLQYSRIFAAGTGSPVCNPGCGAPAVPVALRSLDSGSTWGAMNGLASEVTALAATANLPSRYLAGTQGAGIFQSLDGGANWTAASDGLTSKVIASLVVDAVTSTFAYAGTVGGVNKAFLSQTSTDCTRALLYAPSLPACLNGRRFYVSASVRTSTGGTDFGRVIPLTDNATAFWFFDPNNVELVVKVLDGRSINGKFWVFTGVLTTLECTITVTDTLTGAVRTYSKPQGSLTGLADLSAF